MQAAEWIVLAVEIILIFFGWLFWGSSKLLSIFFYLLATFILGLIIYSYLYKSEADYTIALYPEEKILYEEKGIYAQYQESYFETKKGITRVRTRVKLSIDAKILVTNLRIIFSDRVAFSNNYAQGMSFYLFQKDIESLDWRKYEPYLKSQIDLLPNGKDVLPQSILNGLNIINNDSKGVFQFEYAGKEVSNQVDTVKIWFKDMDKVRYGLFDIKKDKNF